jgi:hypothetical protein
MESKEAVDRLRAWANREVSPVEAIAQPAVRTAHAHNVWPEAATAAIAYMGSLTAAASDDDLRHALRSFVEQYKAVGVEFWSLSAWTAETKTFAAKFRGDVYGHDTS